MTFEAIQDRFNTLTDQISQNIKVFCDSSADYIKKNWLTKYQVSHLSLSYNLRELTYVVVTAVAIAQIFNSIFLALTFSGVSMNLALGIVVLFTLRHIVGKSIEAPLSPEEQVPGEALKKNMDTVITALFGNFVDANGIKIEWHRIPHHLSGLLKK